MIFRKNKPLILLFFTFFFHFIVGFLIFHFSFYPFFVADTSYYHQIAKTLADRWREGNFFKDDLWINSWFIYFVAPFYLIFPTMNMGIAVVAIEAGFTAVLLYLIIKEMGVKENIAFVFSLFVSNLYPSYLYYGSLLLKDTLIIPLILLMALAFMRFSRFFRFRYLFLFGASLFVLYHCRPHYAFISSFCFLVSIFFIFQIPLKKRFLFFLSFLFVFLLVPYFARLDFGGIKLIKSSTPAKVDYVRSIGYTIGESSLQIPFLDDHKNGTSWLDWISSLTNVKNYLYNFLSVFLGPFPWQITKAKYLFSLFETIPLWLIVFFLLKNYRLLLQNHFFFSFFFVAMGIIGIIAILSDNLGANVRYRMPALFLIFSFFPFVLSKQTRKVSN